MSKKFDFPLASLDELFTTEEQRQEAKLERVKEILVEAFSERCYRTRKWTGCAGASMAKAQGVTESFKAADQMEWVGRMNNIRSAAEEIIREELIYS